MKMRKSIIFLCLTVFVVVYAGCAGKQITKSDEIASAQNESAIKQNEQTRAAVESAKQSNSKEQTTRKQIEDDLTDIHFDFDQYSIRPEDRKILSSHADLLLKNKKVKIVIEGNCDERGTDEYNMALGQRRADEAKKYLINMGVNKKRVSTISYGKERPLDPEHNEEAWAKNRRDCFVVE